MSLFSDSALIKPIKKLWRITPTALNSHQTSRFEFVFLVSSLYDLIWHLNFITIFTTWSNHMAPVAQGGRFGENLNH